jgi:PST family polysaccharide transporter
VILPVVATGYIVGLPYGASGVAAGYTIAMALWVYPHLIWCTRETTLTPWRMLRVAKTPAAACVVAAAAAYGVHLAFDRVAPLPRLVVEGVVLSLTYVLVLLWVREERSFYVNLLRSLRTAGAPGAA